MNNFKILFFPFVLFIGLLHFSSCGDDIDCDDTAAIEDLIEDEFDALIAASEVFAANPEDSDACNDFKDAIEDFINVSRDIEECVPAEELDEYRENLEELENQSDMLDC